ncbi:conserved hypothetical protein [Tenacibaculum sp. 190524A05c]|uniref:hypothetical protein n=1 Tax=Tenacibaculum platacis TaxID=3137852 RepID=UPI0031FB724B
MIKNTDHCALCDLSETNLKLGLVCSLTNDSPKFHHTCTKIKLNIRLEDKLKELDEKSEELEYRKSQVIRNFFIYPILGICVLIGDYFIYQNFINNYDILSIDNLQNDSPTILIAFIIILLFGFGLIGKAIGPYLNYKQDKELLQVEFNTIDDVLDLYRFR